LPGALGFLSEGVAVLHEFCSQHLQEALRIRSVILLQAGAGRAGGQAGREYPGWQQ